MQRNVHLNQYSFQRIFNYHLREVNFDTNPRQFEGSSYQKHFDRLKNGRIVLKLLLKRNEKSRKL
jgi:hypothetical protein